LVAVAGIQEEDILVAGDTACKALVVPVEDNTALAVDMAR
jgi:hypothetical protein